MQTPIQFYWNHTSGWLFFCKYATYLQQSAFFLENSSRERLLYIVLNIEVIKVEVLSKQVKKRLNYISIL